MQSFVHRVCVCMCMRVHVFVRERERERERERVTAAASCVCARMCERGRKGHTTVACVQTHELHYCVCHATLSLL